MVRVNLTRESYEVISETNGGLSVTRQNAEVMGDAGVANGERANLTRMSYEMIFETPPVIAATRQNVEVMGDVGVANSERVDLTRMSYETIAALFRRIGVTRQNVEVMADAGVANGERVNLSRMSYEVLSRKGPNAIIPLPLATDVDFFFHNWADQPTIESGWLTDIQQASTGAEERRGLTQRPLRTMSVFWFPSEKAEADRMLVALRKMTQGRFQIPLYMDQTPMQAAAASGTNVLNVSTLNGRFFNGGRIAIVKRSGVGGMTPLSVQYAQIQSRTTSQITLVANLTANVAAGDLVIPMMDCETMLRPQMQYVKAYGATVKLTVTEVPGPSQLPARISDFPDGFARFAGKPIFNIEPDWINGVDVGLDRQGDRANAGRADLTYLAADRARLTASYFLSAQRAEGLKIIDFFETRRGRLRSFWLVDQDQLWTATAATTTFLDINPLGDFDNFQEEMDFVAVVMKDGTIHVREVVTIQAVLGVWRLTVTPDLPAIDLTQVRRIARARYVRFDSDAMTESWATDGVMTTRLGFIECLREEDVEL